MARSRTGGGIVVATVAGLAAATGLATSPALAEPPAAASEEPIGRYLADLERSRRLPPGSASAELLAATLAEAEDRLVRGDSLAATSLLFAIVEAPRFARWKDTVPMASAEFQLGRALLRGGAHLAAERMLLRALRRGAGGPTFVPAFRALVDLALATREYARVAGILGAAAPETALPRDSRSEERYLRGRAAYDAGDLATAEDRFAGVDRLSRLYPAAAYFRGLVSARRREWTAARSAFCELADQPADHRLAFQIDARYFELKDLARLGLARVAHERGHYEESYYFYLSIPEESERLPEALYEAAWSMFEKGEVRAAAAFAQQFERLFPRSPLMVEVAILKAMIDLKACAFDRARDAARFLASEYEPLAAEIAVALAQPDRRRALVDRLLASDGTFGAASQARAQARDEDRAAGHEGAHDGEIALLFRLDRRFREVRSMLFAIDEDIAEARGAARRWRVLGAEATQGDGRPLGAVASADAAGLLDDALGLLDLAGQDPVLDERLQRLLVDVSLAAHPPAAAGPFAEEARRAGALARDLLGLRARVVEAAQALATDALADLDRRVRAALRQARLVHIDAAVGKKKKLEVEIQDLRAGKLPAEVFFKLKADGVLGDDEEYWPFEGEHWADEYTDYK